MLNDDRGVDFGDGWDELLGVGKGHEARWQGEALLVEEGAILTVGHPATARFAGGVEIVESCSCHGLRPHLDAPKNSVLISLDSDSERLADAGDVVWVAVEPHDIVVRVHPTRGVFGRLAKGRTPHLRMRLCLHDFSHAVIRYQCLDFINNSGYQ